jgi:GNAT superfamily N-acetyltransferase
MSVPRTRPPYRITTDVSRFDLDQIWRWLRGSYWARGIPRALVERSVRGALSFGVMRGKRQVALARVITDRATFAYLADVFVDESVRGQGLGRWLMEVIRAHPELQGLRRWMLATRDAHGLYTKVGFRSLAHPEWLMEITRPNPYRGRAARVRSSRRARRASG